MTEDAAGPEPIKPVLELFRSNCTAFWATTYNMDLGLFNEFLLGRLGEPPLNIAVLADQERVATTLARIPPEKTDQIAVVNRRWLLRGARIGSGRFHPKSYLAVTATRATLLVGSGNLSAGGLDEGREVFTPFVSGSAAGDGAISVWRAWMKQLVEAIDDVRLAERFADLETKLPDRVDDEDAAGPSLMHNLDRPLAEQFISGVTEQLVSPVDELLVTAPFFDREAAALGVLIERLAPRAITLYVTTTTSVDGQQLERRLQASGAHVRVFAYDPDRFTHAKLIGVIAGSDGWLLSGSANISRAALSLTARDGNVELAVLTPLTPQEVRGVFLPPEVTAEPREIGALAGLEYMADTDEGEAAPVRLVRATGLSDNVIEVDCEPPAQPGWRLDDLASRSLLQQRAGRTVTTGPLAGRLVFLVDQEGTVLSNRVVVDDPQELDAVLHRRSREGTERPPELMAGDLDTPVGRALQWVHRNLLMDVTERTAAGGSGATGAAEREADADNDLWDRLEREHLGRDPRAGTYQRLWRRQSALGTDEPILELLEAMRDRIPVPGLHETGTPPLTLLALVLEDEPLADEDEKEHSIRRWKAQTRIRVRARNVLRRWAAAQTDPRLLWIDPLAPAKNFAVIAAVFARLWRDIAVDPTQSELTADDMNDLWFDWLSPFVGTDRTDGWLDQPEVAESGVVERLSDDLPEIVAALCWLAVRSEDRTAILRWQPVLKRALEHRLLEPTATTARFLSAVAHASIVTGAIEERLLACIEFIDDDLWCERTSSEMDLDRLRLEPVSHGQQVGVRLLVQGVTDPLNDPRLPQLIVAARRYRRCDGVAIFSEDSGWRITATTGESAAFIRGEADRRMIESEVLPAGVIEHLASRGEAIGDLFVMHEVA
jgi:hypothetical protein